MHHLSKRLCAILLILCMVIGFLPMTTRAALVDSSSYVSQQLTLADEFVLHLLSNNIPEAYQNEGHAELTYPMGMDGNKVTKTYRIEDVTKNNSGYYDLPVERVVAQMADDIELVVKSDDLGVEVIKQTYSIRKYAEALINGLYTRQTKDLCYEMLNYGAWAQKYFGYNTDNLANEGYEIEPGYDISNAEKRDVSVAGDLEGIKVYGATVVFLSEAAVRFYFTTANDIKNYTFFVGGVEYAPRAKSGHYYIEVSGINPQEMETEMNVKVTDGDNDLSFTYAPIDFFVRSYKNSTDATYKGLLAAAYSYYSAAKAFAGNSITGAIELDLVYYSGDNNSLTVQTDLAYAANMTVNSATGDWDTGISQTQEASAVAIGNQDSKASLTFQFDNAFSVGDTYSLSKGMAFVINNQEYVLNEDYVFQLAATGESAYKWNTVEPVATGNSLLGFENYTQITGADTGVKLSVGNMLGRMELNTDRKYVSEGVASLKVQPQGDYTNPGKHPYIKLDMSGVKNTTFEGTISQITSHADFSGYKSISFDVYNPENEAQEIRAGLMIGADSYISTNKQKFTLAPNSWTTCTYDLSVMAGFGFYELDSERFVIIEFLDHKETKDDVPPVLYIDDLVANNYQDGESPVDTVYNYRTGIDFETSGLEYLFIGQGIMERDAAIERVSYAESDISAPANGGSYGLKLSHDSNYWPTFRIHFGEELPAGTAVTFDAYGVITSGTNLYNQSIFEYSAGGEATEQFPCGQWTALELTLNESASYIDLCWNIDRAHITSATASGEVYIDNVKVVTNITPEGNILDGFGFEKIGNTAYFSSASSAVRKMPYATLGITAPDGGDQNALEVTQSGASTTVTINFGQELAAGTVISFKLYGTHSGGWVTNSGRIALSTNNGTVNFSEINKNEWADFTITLSSAASSVDLTGKVSYFLSRPSSVSLYLDKVKAVEPVGTASGSYYDGIGFEVKENAYYFVGQGGSQDASIRRVAYAELDISAPADGGDYALKLSHDSDQWPHFRMNFHTELPAGTVISFQAYLKADAPADTVFEYNGISSGSAPGEATVTFACNTWHTLTLTLPAAASYVDLFWNMERAGYSGASELYLDNLVVVSGDFEEGVGFESVGHTGMFTGQGAADDAVLARVSHADLAASGITALANGGTYALKLSNAASDQRYPKFRVNFGKTLPVGTVITFDAYGRITKGANSYDQSIFEYSAGGEATAQFKCGAWTELTITLKEETDHLDLFWNFDRAGFGDDVTEVSAEVYLDNFLAEAPVDPEGDFFAGVGFEVKGNIGLFTGVEGSEAYRNAALKRVSYSDAGISAPANGGSYAMKLTHASNQWPVFRINFGTTLKAGTVITFDAYTRDTTQAVGGGNVCIFEQLTANTVTTDEQFSYDAWDTQKITLTSDASYLDLVCTLWRWEDSSWATVPSSAANIEVYMDNFLAVEPIVTEGDFLEGVGFEVKGNIGLFSGVGGDDAYRDLTMSRFAYNEDVEAPENGGAYGLKLTNGTDNQWPTFKINFGKTLPAGTVLTFDAYSECASGQADNAKSIVVWFGADNKAGGGDDVELVNAYDAWTTLSLTLTEATDSISFYWNMDQQNTLDTSKLADYALYLDNFLAVEPIVTEGDFLEGVDFEVAGNIGLFTGVGGDYTSRDATIRRFAHTEDTEFENGGEYALELTHASNMWPTFRMNFGKTLPAGTVITFNALINYTQTLDSNSGRSVFEPLDNTVFRETAEFTYNDWAELSITLLKDADYVDLFWNVNRGGASIELANIALYLDNFQAAVPADFLAGVDFETVGHENSFTGTNGGQAATVERVSYADANVAAPTNGGSYALKLSHTSNSWPWFRIDFGKTLPAGTTITFDVYGNYEYETTGTKYFKVELSANSKNFATCADPYQVLWTVVDTWNTGITITLTAESDYLELFWNVADGGHGESLSSWILLDNIKATIPEDEAADFEAGVTFEKPGHEASFAGITDGVAIQRVSYANLAIDSDGRGDYALALSHESNCWPNFRINFGKTLPAGTTITFDAYGNYEYEATDTKYIKVELTGDAKTYATSSSTDQVIWTVVDTWAEGTITLTADSDHLDLFWNVADGRHGDSLSSVLLLDNIKAVVPEMAFIDGVTFEEDIGTDLFDDSTAWNAATAERVSYADVGLAASAERGEYALKYSYTGDSAWPAFRINFGKTLPAGTTITFDAYGNYDYVAAEGVTKYMKVQLNSSFATSSNPDQIIWTVVETWITCDTITLTTDSDYLDLFWNVADGNHGNASSWLLLDNIKVVEPISTSLSFEFAYQADYFTGTGNATTDATIERVAYADLGIGAPGSGDGGEYAIKLSHSSNMYPTFRINFGRTVAAGTTLKFDAYGTFENYESGWSMSIHLGDWTKDTYLPIETWMEDYNSLVLPADCTYIDLLWNIERGQITEGRPSFIVLDNIELVEP